MRLSFDIGIFKVNLSDTGGVRVGIKNKETYISQRLTKPSKKKGVDIIEF